MKRQSLQRGFSMLEVLIALAIATFALTALAMGQLKSLQQATNSFQYTVALVEANNAIERVWNDICLLQQQPDKFNADFIQSISPKAKQYQLNLTGVTADNFSNKFTVEVSWSDERLNDSLANQVSLNAMYPVISPWCEET